MRLLMSSSDQHDGEMKKFSNWILDVRNRNIGSTIGDESKVEISDDLLITTTNDPLSHLVDFAYPNLLQNICHITGMKNEYLSSDTTSQVDENEDVQQEWFIPEFLNDIKCSRLSNHKLTLKPGVAVMLLRNID
ncbi:uncharacterized protein LOC107493946 [Arachis duranensis]|uniref:Uncharacterized protein LOC107493946 n=1 Tax=Arachis duranensis TaxID=130453 RepID=A0A6P4DLT4_ARADU|nr:uncharacterized protein LOC107493946 [Arachis duranensis]